MAIGWINMVRLLDESTRGKALSNKLRTVVEGWQNKAQTLEAKLQRIQENLGKMPENASAEVKFAQQRDSQLLEMELRQIEERMRHDLDTSREHYRNQLLTEVKPILDELAGKKSLEAVLVVPSQDVAYVNPANDLTPDLLKAMDAKLK